jgi:hypothetical protein
MMSKKIAPWLLLLIGAVSGFFLYNKYRVAPDIHLPELSLRTLSGEPVSLNDYKGKALFVSYWATWCPDCLKEMPSVERAALQLDTSSMVFVMISDESPERINAYLAKHNYPMVFLRTDQRLQELGINSIPTTYVYDKQHAEVLNRVGGATWDDPAMINILKQVMEK